MANIWNDILKEYDKHKKCYSYSMRRIIIAILVPYGLIIGVKIVWYAEKNVNAVFVFNTVWTFIAVGLGINLASYIKNEPEGSLTQYNEQNNININSNNENNP
jgi:hypothetical protein